MPERLLIDDFLQRAKTIPILDVRSPGEFEHGHIPTAHNLPLFTNEERALVGTCYKQKGKQPAIDLGLEIVGPKLASFVKTARALAVDEQILVHCWRGGMRSGSMAWLFETAGLKTTTLVGGYKAFRKKVLAAFQEPYSIHILGGETGSGKTEILQAIQHRGEQILDLEALACHRGSSFGALGMQPQPTIEQFENELFQSLQQLDHTRTIWIEDESKTIGRIFVPIPFWKQMAAAPLYRIRIPLELRVKRLVRDYGNFPVEQLHAAIQRIQKRLGGLDFKLASDALTQGDLETVVRITLRYYDKAYDFPHSKKPPGQVRFVDSEEDNAEINASLILQAVLENK